MAEEYKEEEEEMEEEAGRKKMVRTGTMIHDTTYRASIYKIRCDVLLPLYNLTLFN